MVLGKLGFGGGAVGKNVCGDRGTTGRGKGRAGWCDCTLRIGWVGQSEKAGELRGGGRRLAAEK